MVQMQAVAEAEELVRVPQVAQRLNVSPSMIRKLISIGEIKAVRIGSTIRVPVSEVERLKREGTRPLRFGVDRG